MILDFLLPAPCVVCNTPPKPLCSSCVPASKVSIETKDFGLLVSASELSGSLEKVLSSYKDKQRLALESTLVNLLDGAMKDVARNISFDCFAIPPRNKKNYRKRGFHPIERIVRRSSLSKYRRVFTATNRVVEDQRALSSNERRQNVDGAFSFRPGAGRLLLADDVFTTGATMSELAQAARLAGFEIAGACVIARRFPPRFSP